MPLARHYATALRQNNALPFEGSLASFGAIGKHLRLAGATLTIAGVVADVHHTQLDIAPQPEVYLAYEQMDATILDVVGRGLYFAVRSSLPAATAARQLRAAIHQVDPAMAVQGVRPMNALIDESVAEPRFRALSMALFAGLAVLLACVGIYGVVAYTVAQRRYEIGVQMALGASQALVMRNVLVGTLKLVLPAAGAGLAVAWSLSHFLGSFLFGISSTDLPTYLTCPLLFVGIALAAAWAPARRAAAVDPMTILRQG